MRSRDLQGILEQNANSRFYVGTSDFFHEIQEKLVPKTFPENGHVTWQSTQLYFLRIDGASADFSKVF